MRLRCDEMQIEEDAYSFGSSEETRHGARAAAGVAVERLAPPEALSPYAGERLVAVADSTVCCSQYVVYW